MALNLYYKKIIKQITDIKVRAIIFLLLFLHVICFAQAPNISYSGPKTFILSAPIAALSPINTGGTVPATIYGKVSTVVRTHDFPSGITTDALGNLYVTEESSNLILKINSAGIISTFAGNLTAGSTDGTGTAASFFGPRGLTTDAAGNIYVGDINNSIIRKITPTGVVTTLAGRVHQPGADNGIGAKASFNEPTSVATDAAANVYVADRDNHLIRKITPAGVVTTFAGGGPGAGTNGTGTAANFNFPSGVATDSAGNVYVADKDDMLIRKITPSGVVTTFAGSGLRGSANGPGTVASFDYPLTLATDISGNVYVIENLNQLVRKITPAGVVTTLAGSGAVGSIDGIGTAASFNSPVGIATDLAGNVYVTDYATNLIRKITVTGYTISPALPVGLNFDGTTGIISGTPTMLSPVTNYTITAYNATGSSTTSLALSVTLPSPRLQLTITSESCDGSSDGSVNIRAEQTSNYTATITGRGLNNQYHFTDTTTINNLAAGTYNICITVAGDSTYQNCYSVTLTQPQPLSVYASIDNSEKTVALTLNGGSTYNILLNGTHYSTTDNIITLPVKTGNNTLNVTTDKLCQGTFAKLFNTSGVISVYPVPFQNTLNVNIGNTNISQLSVKIFDIISGKLVYSNQYVNQSGVLQFELSGLVPGVYELYLISDNSQNVFKITK